MLSMSRSVAAAARFAALAVLAEGSFAVAQEESAELTPEEQQAIEAYEALLSGLDPQTGEIVLGDGLATLVVPESFYFLDGEDAETVLVDLWGNMPGQNVLGMLFPAEYSPMDMESWAVTLEYTADGYVSDEDAASIDYDDLLRDMQRDTRDSNQARIEAGYDAVELLGWAAPPRYDAEQNKLYWAKELRFGDMDSTTLNYEIRALGRRGILSMTFIANSEQLGEINESLDTVLAMAEFNEGNRYSDFNPSIDEVAAYGLGALVAGKVAAKTGVFAAILLFLKKFGVFILIGIAALGRRIIGIFKTEKLEMKDPGSSGPAT